MLGMPLNELAFIVAMIIVGGIVTGLLAGTFGIGGGAVIVPVLYEIFRILSVPDTVRMQLCVGTSIAIIVPTTVRSYLAHRAKGAVLTDVMRAWALPAVIGVAAGSIIAVFAPSAVFKLVFVLIAATIAFKMLVGRDTWRIADEFPGRNAMAGYGFFIGISSSLMGVSGGSISNMLQTLYGIPLLNAVATSAGLGVPITIAGAIGYMLAGLPHQSEMPPLSIGFVSLIGVVLIAPISSYAAPYGARLAHAMSKRHLEIAFGCFLLAASARFLASLF
ncbi:MAG TPA: sulfite exporter TauE/SafE family protein [Xanthobacteraceae bacterium]|nr:sulfite exporter TauE/SafE family protein [Xanthobacteraceae bacterium]